ncbi:MAG TPA: hypothetical protein VJW77_00775 [Terriglobia bacterium]|nr:hypothetical protein [Terriglobia bacterium]
MPTPTIINLNDTAPAAPAGSRNIEWQGDAANPRNVSASLPAFVASGASHMPGAVPDPGPTAGSTKFLREDASWAVPAGGGGGGALTLLEEHTAISGDTQMVFNSISATYDDYLLEILHFTPLTNGDSLWLQVSANGGSTWVTTASYNYETWQYQTGFNAILGSTSDTKIQFGGGVSSTIANGGGSYSIRLVEPLDTTRNKAFLLLQSYRPVSSDGNPYAAQGGGAYLSTSAYNAFRLLFSTGNIAAGIGRLYGISK